MRTVSGDDEHFMALEIGCPETQHSNFGSTVIALDAKEMAHIESGDGHPVNDKMVPGYACEGRVGPFRIVLRVII